MNEELENITNETPEVETNNVKQQLTTVTTFSKYLALALFVTLPFIGGWIGYHYAPEKVVEVERVVVVKKMTEVDSLIISETQEDGEILARKTYLNEKYGFGFSYSNKFDLWENDYSISNKTVWTQVILFSADKENNIDIHSEPSEGYCHKSLCDVEVISQIIGEFMVWDFLGPSVYCDVGQCSETNYVYRSKHEGRSFYVNADKQEGVEIILQSFLPIKNTL